MTGGMIDPRAIQAADDLFSAAFGWRPGGSKPVPALGATRACPDCGRPQHYTGHENGWAHDAGWYHDNPADTWDCADPRKADTDRRLISHLTRGCTCDHRPGDPCNASCPIHLGAGLRRA